MIFVLPLVGAVCGNYYKKLITSPVKKLSFDDCSIYYTNIADPYTPRHIINANIVAGTSAQP
jgi:hypothetical protein